MRITAIFGFVYLFFNFAYAADGPCLTTDEFHLILHRWVSLFNTVHKDVIKEVARPDITLWSDSADFLFGARPGSRTGVPTFGNRTQLLQGLQDSQVGRDATSTHNRFYTLHTPNNHREASFGCDSITYHWRFDGRSKGNIPGSTNHRGAHVGSGGIHYMLIDNSVKKIHRVYEEFNVGEQLYTSGAFVCFQKKNESACPSF